HTHPHTVRHCFYCIFEEVSLLYVFLSPRVSLLGSTTGYRLLEMDNFSDFENTVRLTLFAVLMSVFIAIALVSVSMLSFRAILDQEQYNKFSLLPTHHPSSRSSSSRSGSKRPRTQSPVVQPVRSPQKPQYSNIRQPDVVMAFKNASTQAPPPIRSERRSVPPVQAFPIPDRESTKFDPWSSDTHASSQNRAVTRTRKAFQNDAPDCLGRSL
ncbi:hypothetical protein GGR58DRAFT_521281, partial [Xylaria digitata]